MNKSDDDDDDDDNNDNNNDNSNNSNPAFRVRFPWGENIISFQCWCSEPSVKKQWVREEAFCFILLFL